MTLVREHEGEHQCETRTNYRDRNDERYAPRGSRPSPQLSRSSNHGCNAWRRTTRHLAQLRQVLRHLIARHYCKIQNFYPLQLTRPPPLAPFCNPGALIGCCPSCAPGRGFPARWRYAPHVRGAVQLARRGGGLSEYCLQQGRADAEQEPEQIRIGSRDAARSTQHADADSQGLSGPPCAAAGLPAAEGRRGGTLAFFFGA